MKKKNTREWFKIGKRAPVFIYMDFVLRYPIACIEILTEPDGDSIPSWMPNSDESTVKLIAYARSGEKEFTFNPHNEEESSQVMADAMNWCEDNTFPPISVLNKWSFVMKCLMFWKYDKIWHEGRLIGLKYKEELPQDEGHKI